MSPQVEVLIAGSAAGETLRLDAPISFWGGVDPKTSRIVLPGHPQEGALIAGRVLALPDPIGSSSSSSILLELIHRRIAPLALILGRRDAILPVGVIAAGQMGWPTIPVLLMTPLDLKTGQHIAIDAGGQVSTG